MTYYDISDLVGKTITAIEVNENKDEIRIACDDGSTYLMYHSQACYESVGIEEIIGDLEDLIGSPILQAEEVSHTGSDSDTSDWPEGVDKPGEDSYLESYTWTFYKLTTNKGGVTLRWYGRSNGYYSVRMISCALI